MVNKLILSLSIMLLYNNIWAINVEQKGDVLIIDMPEEILEKNNYILEVDSDKSDKLDKREREGKLKSPKLKSDIELDSIIFKAHLLYKDGEYEDAMKLLDMADRNFPDHYKIKTMKGSIFYLMGYPKMAILNWKKSLELNPNQMQVKEYKEKLEKKIKKGSSQKSKKVNAKTKK